MTLNPAIPMIAAAAARERSQSGIRRFGTRLLAVLTVLGALPAVGGELGPVFRVTGVVDGLPDSRVEAVVQDAHGYIWIATQSGLVRHEGTRLHVLGTDPDQPDPLPGRNIMALHAHSDGTVWAAVDGHGLVQIGPDLGARHHLATGKDSGPLPDDNVWSIAEDCKGRIWIGHSQRGVSRFDPESGAYRHYPGDETDGLAPSGYLMKLTTDSRCRVWVAQTEQLSVYEPGSERFRAVAERGDGHFIQFVGEAHGRIYYSQGQKLYALGAVKQAPAGSPRVAFEAPRIITGFAPEPGTDHLFVTTYDGLFRWQAGGEVSLHLRSIRGVPNSLPSNALLGVMFDAENGAWITVPRHGVAYLPPGHGAFERYQPVPGSDRGIDVAVITALAAEDDGRAMWFGNWNGEVQTLGLADGRTNWLHELHDHELLSSLGPVVDLVPEQDTMLVVSHSRLLELHRRSGQLRQLLRREELTEGTFSFVRAGDSGRLWVATYDAGLFRLDRDSLEREHFHPEGEGKYELAESAPAGLTRGPQGNWWLAGEHGVYRLDEYEGFERVLAVDRPPLLAFAWHGDTLWLGTEVTLESWRWQDNAFSQTGRYPLPEALPPGRVHDLFPTDGHGVWLVRSSGLARLDPASGRFRNFTQSDGLAVSEFMRRASLQLPDGRLAIGGSSGLVLVDPAKVQGPAVAPPVHVTALQAGSRRYPLSPDEPHAVALNHDSNSFFIDYQGLSYVSAEQNHYRVELEGWDEDWLEFAGQNRHYYSSLPSGSYRFRVQAATPGGLWNETGDELAIRIHHPPWLGGWALAGYALLGVTGAGLGWRSLQRARRRRREFREARQKRALAEEQSQVIARLNRSLEPLELAATIGREMLRVTGGTRACVGYQHELLPGELVSTDDAAEPPSRDRWRARLDQADGQRALAVTLVAEEHDAARVLIEAGPDGFAGDYRERLDLLVQMAGQALHNALLLERVRALAVRAEQASSAKSEFLATMSHEIRTPLHGVLGMVELLYQTESEPGQQDILDTLRQSGLQLQRIIDDVLDISRIEAGRLSLNEQSFELVATLEQVVDLHAPNAARKDLDLRLRIASGLPLMAVGDADRLSQVLGNLLSNAVKFTETGGVELVAEVGADGQLVLIVGDSGPGIGEADRERLFEPFTQLDASITRSHSGSGLGLAICRRLVDAMNGRLDVMPPCRGGSRFRVRVPVLQQSLNPFPERPTRLLEGTVVSAHVDAPVWRVLRRLCRRWEIELVSAAGTARRSSLLLVDPRHGDSEGAAVDDWRQQAAAMACLQSPFARAGSAGPALPDGAYFLRWPLVESRLIGLLLDLNMHPREGSSAEFEG